MTSPVLQANLETPLPGESIYDQSILLSGWIYAAHRGPASCRLRAYLDEDCCAETRTLFYRPDICKRLGLPDHASTGFRMLGRLPTALTTPREATLRVTASWAEENPLTIAEQPVRLLPAALAARPYGEVVAPENEVLLHREIFTARGHR